MGGLGKYNMNFCGFKNIEGKREEGNSQKKRVKTEFTFQKEKES